MDERTELAVEKVVTIYSLLQLVLISCNQSQVYLWEVEVTMITILGYVAMLIFGALLGAIAEALYIIKKRWWFQI